MRPSEACKKYKEVIRQIVARHRVTNPRVFGSALREEDAGIELIPASKPQ